MSETPVLDTDVPTRLVSELGTEDTAEILATFLGDTRRKVDLMSANAIDVVNLRREAHSIKSSAATFGFKRLSGLAFALEQNAANLTPDELRSATGALDDEFESTAHFARSVLLASNFAVAS